MFDIDIYYFITKDKWEAHKAFIINICKIVYETSCTQRELLQTIPIDIYGELNPTMSLKFHREEQIKKIIQ